MNLQDIFKRLRGHAKARLGAVAVVSALLGGLGSGMANSVFEVYGEPTAEQAAKVLNFYCDSFSAEARAQFRHEINAALAARGREVTMYCGPEVGFESLGVAE